MVETREKIKSSLHVLDIDRGCGMCGRSSGGHGSSSCALNLTLSSNTKSSLLKLRSAGIDVSEDFCNSLETFCDVGVDGELLYGRNGTRAGVNSGAVWVAFGCCCCASERTGAFVVDKRWSMPGISKRTWAFVLD